MLGFQLPEQRVLMARWRSKTLVARTWCWVKNKLSEQRVLAVGWRNQAKKLMNRRILGPRTFLMCLVRIKGGEVQWLGDLEVLALVETALQVQQPVTAAS